MATEVDQTTGILLLVGIILGIAVPIVLFWVLIIWCSRRKRKRMAQFNETPAAADPVADDVENGTGATAAPAEAAKEEKVEKKEGDGGGENKSVMGAAVKSAKSGKSAKTGEDEKTGDGK